MKKIIALLLALVMVASFCAVSVFAEETTANDGNAAVSSTDTATQSVIASLGLTEIELEDFNFSMTIPSFATLCTAESTSSEIYSTFGVTQLDFISEYGFIIYAYSADGMHSISAAVDDTTYSRMIGNLSKLDDTEFDNFASNISTSFGITSVANISRVTINGNDFVHLISTTVDDASAAAYDAHAIVTVVDGVMYTIVMQLTNVTDAADLTAIDTCINSIRIGKGGNGFMGMSAYNHTAEYILIAVVAVLLILVGFMTFFIIRFSLFSRAADSSFNIIGFDLPANGDDDEYDDYDEDEYDEDEDDEDDYDEVEDEDEDEE